MVCGVMLNQLQQVFLVTSALMGMVSMSAISAAWAETVSTDQRVERQETGSNNRRSPLVTGHSLLDDPEGQMTNDNGQMTHDNEQTIHDQPATTVKEWIAQIEASLVQITGVRVETTEAGLQVVLETAEGELSTPATQTLGNALIADIPSAVLALPEGDEFQQANPIEGIALVSVTGLPENRVRVAITGVDAPPTANVSVEASGLVLAVTPGTEVTETDEDAIQVVVTGEQETGYRVPRTSVGTRTETPLLDIPASVQAVPQEVIEDQGAANLSEALRNVSGVVTDRSSRAIFSRFTIRGFNSGNTFLRNGISDNDVGRLGIDLSNIERVEVLKGPASVLYGQLSPGGVINIVTESPLPFPFYSVEGAYGSFNTYQGAVDLSGPLNENGSLLYRLNASMSGSDTFIDEIDIDRYLIAPVFTWQLSEDTTLTLETEYLDAQYPNDRGLPVEGTVLFNPNGEIPRSRYLGEPSFDRNNRRTLRTGYDFEHRFSENWTLRNNFRFLWEEINQDYILSFSLLDDFRTLERTAAIAPSFQNNYEATTQVTGNFYTGNIAHELLVGVDFATEVGRSNVQVREIGDIDIFDPVYNQPLGAVTSNSRSVFKSETFGIYLQDQISLSDNFILVLGGRFDIVNQTFEDLIANTTDFQQDEAFSPAVGLVYQPTENLSLYGRFSRSFEQVTGTMLDNRLFEPQRGTLYEVGLKAEILDGRLFGNLALYNIIQSNVLTSDPRDPNFSIQTGEQRSRGVELDIAGEILPGWDIIASYAYTDARVTEDNQIPEGNRLNNVPEHTFSLWNKYEIQSGDLQGLGFGLGLFYVGERQGDLDNTFQLPSYLRTDAALYYQRNNFQAQLNFKNLFGINYFEASEGRRVFPGAPFEVLATVRWEF
jgi:iron complex outermembrane receptor protein